METNLGNTLIGILSVLICIGPFLGIYLVKVRNTDQLPKV